MGGEGGGKLLEINRDVRIRGTGDGYAARYVGAWVGKNESECVLQGLHGFLESVQSVLVSS
jgi:hypothetical protein